MVKDHSDSERGNPLSPHRLLFPISSKGSFICTIPQTGWHIPRPLVHWLEREIAQWVHPMMDRSESGRESKMKRYVKLIKWNEGNVLFNHAVNLILHIVGIACLFMWGFFGCFFVFFFFSVPRR